MHPNFGIIATQNPNKGAFTNKRRELWLSFLSKFQRINFPNFTKDELIDISIGLARQSNYKDDILMDIVSFYMDWQEKMNSIDDVQCFTIRGIRAFTQNKNIYDTIMTIYGERYQKDIKNQLKEELKKYKALKDLRPSPLSLPEEFPHCFLNDSLCETNSSLLFSLTNKRHSLMIGEDESGITQVARWCTDCFDKMINNETKESIYICAQKICNYLI